MMQQITLPCDEAKVQALLEGMVSMFNHSNAHPYDVFNALERMLTHLVQDMMDQKLLVPPTENKTPHLTLVKNDEVL